MVNNSIHLMYNGYWEEVDMYLIRKKLNTIENIIDIPDYNIQVYGGFAFGGELPGINNIFPIFVVYRNKKDMTDVLVDIHIEMSKTHEQIVFSREFLTKFFSDTEFSEHLVEKNGRMFVSGFKNQTLHHVPLSLYCVENSLAYNMIDKYGIELAIALTHKSVDDIKKAQRVRELLYSVHVFKMIIHSDSRENMEIHKAEENIKHLNNEIRLLDSKMNKVYQEIEDDNAILDKYGANWENLIE